MMFRSRSTTGDPLPSLEALRSLIATAADLAERLHADPLLARWLSAFEDIPPTDRAAVVDIVERDVALRAHSAAGDDTLSGFRTARPNPNARLFLRVFEQDDVPFLPFDHLVQSTIHGARLTHRTLTASPPAAPGWRDALLTAFESLSPEELGSVMWTNQLVLELAEHVRKARSDEGG